MATRIQVRCSACKSQFDRTLKQVNQVIKKTGVWTCAACAAGHNRLDLDGKRFGRWIVMGRVESREYGHGEKKSAWKCRCDCGAISVVTGSALNTGKSKSCGCGSRESTGARSVTHGMSKTRTYRIWQAMLNRCRNPKTAMYPRYGGRGIQVCERWSAFENFISDMGECPPGMSIDRIDNDANYGPGNCRWADRHTQNRNKSSNRFIVHGGSKMCLTDWARSLSMDQASLAERIEKWGVTRALTTPKGKSNGFSQPMPVHR